MYKVKEIYYTIQGEGFHTGRAAVFCRFAGCNLWSGRENDRHKAICQFCDTDFLRTDGDCGGTYDAVTLAKRIDHFFPLDTRQKYIVFTGGEPALQLDQSLIDTVHSFGIEIGVETNGTLPLPEDIDWVCVSPKAHSEIVVRKGQELKVVVPQENMNLETMLQWDFDHYFLQPMEDGKKTKKNTELTIQLVMNHPKWKLSIQTHKYIGLK